MLSTSRPAKLCTGRTRMLPWRSMASEDPSRVAGPTAFGAGDAEGEGQGDDTSFDAKGWLTHAASEMRENFARNRRVMSFGEYFSLFGADPARQVRSAAQ